MNYSDSHLNSVAPQFRFQVTLPKDKAASPKKNSDIFSAARGSLMGVETQMQIAENLSYLQKEQTAALLQSCAEVGRILNGLLASVSRQSES